MFEIEIPLKFEKVDDFLKLPLVLKKYYIKIKIGHNLSLSSIE